jgi:L-rhamnose mutarotase
MQRKAFKMFLIPGNEEEYLRRHDEIWPELSTLLKEVGICNYSIYLDRETSILFAYLESNDLSQLEKLPQQDVMKKWWAYMKDIMLGNPDNSPVSVDLDSMFYLA